MIAALWAAHLTSTAQLLPPPTPSIEPQGNDMFEFEWPTQTGHFYYASSSNNLVDWTFFPVAWPGDGANKSMVAGGPSELFFRTHRSNLPYSGSLNDADPDGDGLTVIEELRDLNHDPARQDSDDNLIIDSMEDSDNDGIIDIVEIKKGSDPRDAADIPDADFIVDPSMADNNSSDNIYETIQEAVDQCPDADTTPDPFRIITVKPGIYGRVFIGGDRRVTLLAEGGDQETVIQTDNSSNALFINEPYFVAHGFVISSAEGSGVYATLGSDEGVSRLSNCIIRDCSNGRFNGGGMQIIRGRMILDHVTATRNSSDAHGRFVSLSGSDTSLVLRNSIVWGNGGAAVEEIYRTVLSAEVKIENSWILGGEFGAHNIDPQITRAGYLMPTSPARDTALKGMGGLTDINGETRDPLPDAGADEFVSLGDGDDDLPDFWERLHFGNLTSLPTGDNDLDGIDRLNNLGEYEANTNPLAKDSDGDQYLDGDEIANPSGASDPLNPDTDGDLFLDGIEILAGMNPLNKRDPFDDFDGDRFPNGFEIRHLSPLAVNDATLRPDTSTTPSGAPKHLVVAPSGGTHSNLKSAINSLTSFDTDYVIIEVAEGSNIEGLQQIEFRSNRPRTLLISQSGAQSVSLYGNLDGEGGELPAIRAFGDLVIDGFTIEIGGVTGDGGGIHLRGDIEDIRIKNCLIRNCHSGNLGGGLYLNSSTAQVDILNSTFFDNDATSLQGGNSIYCHSGTLNLLNTVVWSSRGGDREITRRNSDLAVINLHSCVVEGDDSTYSTAVNTFFDDPQLDSDGLISPSVSPVLHNKGLVTANVSLTDYHGDLRDMTSGACDIGVDEFVDGDDDGYADSWFNDPDSDVDFDGLTNAQEDFYGTSRILADSNGDGISDLVAVFSYTLIDTNGDGIGDQLGTPFGINALGSDPDGDTLTATGEQSRGTSPFLADTDGDGSNDNIDDWPLDPERQTQSSTGSSVAPVITLVFPQAITPL